MTDWLEELLDQVEEADAAEAGMELFARDLPRGRSGGSAPLDRRQKETAQTTGQGEGSSGGRTGDAAPEMEWSLSGRTAPGDGREETIRALGGTGISGGGGDAERTGSGDGTETAHGGGRADRADDGDETDRIRGLLPADLLWGERRRQTMETELYRRVTRAGRERSGSLQRERAAAAEQQSVGTPSLTVDQLDRAVRRDSRRYDGGMELY